MDHATAAEIVRQAWAKVHGTEPSDLERSYAQAIAFLETGYGRIGQFAQMAAQGKYNWGNIEAKRNADGSCPAGYEPGQDQGNVCFRVFSSDVDAAAEFIKQLTFPYGSAPFVQRREGTLEAMGDGTPEDVARAMRTPASVAYYAGPAGTEDQKVAYYAKAIRNALSAIASGAMIPSIPSGPISPSTIVPYVAGGGLPWGFFTLLAVGGVSYWWWRTRTR